MTTPAMTTHWKDRVPGALIRPLRSARELTYRALEPIDAVSRRINHKRDLPPLHLRRYVGPLRTFESSSAEFLAYLKLLVHLQPHESVLDIGCGCGSMALCLRDYLNAQDGRYIGVDINQPSIEWCQRHLTSNEPNIAFAHVDVRNLAFNLNGSRKPTTYAFPFDDESFDVILLKSVLTHMRPEDGAGYLREVSRLLTASGRCLMSAFLLNERQREHSRQGLSDISFDYGDGAWRYAIRNSPETAIAHDEELLLDVIRGNGLDVQPPIYYGTWSGLPNGLSYQDILVLGRQ